MEKKKSNVKDHVKSPYDYLLSFNRAKVLQMFSNGEKVSNIALIKSCSKTAIYRLRKRMIKDGLLTDENELTDKGFNIVKNYLTVPDHVKFNNAKLYQKRDIIRLHNVQVVIKILNKPKGYDYRKNNIISMKVRDYIITDLKNNWKEQFVINDCKVKSNTDSIEIFPDEIYAETEPEASKRLMIIVFDVIKKVENLHKVSLVKENYCNISISKQHFSLIRNGLATLYKKEENKNIFRIFDKEDGKVRLSIDLSKTPEFEGEHPTKSPSDIDKCQTYFKDLGDGTKDYFKDLSNEEREAYFTDIIDNERMKYYTPTENAKMLGEIISVMKEMSYSQKFIIDFLSLNLPKKPTVHVDKRMPEYIG